MVDYNFLFPEFKNGGKNHGGLDRWFAEKWVDIKTGKECGRQKGEKRKGYPACRPSKRITAGTPKTSGELSSAEKAKFKRTKTSSERIPYQHKKAYGGFSDNDLMIMATGGNAPTNPELWSRAKALAKEKYTTYPSAYANGFAAKWYKSKGGSWKKAAYGLDGEDDKTARNRDYYEYKKQIANSLDNNTPILLPTGEEKLYSDMNWKEKAYASGMAVDTRFRLADNPENSTLAKLEDLFNPLSFIGNLAGNLGTGFYESEQSNSILPTAFGVGMPLLMGVPYAGIAGKTMLKDIMLPAAYSIPASVVSGGNRAFKYLAPQTHSKVANQVNKAVSPVTNAINPAFQGAKQQIINKTSQFLPEPTVNLWRIQEKNSRPLSKMAASGELGKSFQNQQAINTFKEREKYFGQWFTNNKKDLDWYRKDREFKNPEIIRLKVPKKELQNFSKYDKSLSRAPEREFIVPAEAQKLYKTNQFLPKFEDGGDAKSNNMTRKERRIANLDARTRAYWDGVDPNEYDYVSGFLGEVIPEQMDALPNIPYNQPLSSEDVNMQGQMMDLSGLDEMLSQYMTRKKPTAKRKVKRAQPQAQPTIVPGYSPVVMDADPRTEPSQYLQGEDPGINWWPLVLAGAAAVLTRGRKGSGKVMDKMLPKMMPKSLVPVSRAVAKREPQFVEAIEDWTGMASPYMSSRTFMPRTALPAGAQRMLPSGQLALPPAKKMLMGPSGIMDPRVPKLRVGPGFIGLGYATGGDVESDMEDMYGGMPSLMDLYMMGGMAPAKKKKYTVKKKTNAKNTRTNPFDFSKL